MGNIKIDSEGRLWRRRSPPAVGSQLVIPVMKRREFIREFHDSLFAGHMGITRTVYRLLDRVYCRGYVGTFRRTSNHAQFASPGSHPAHVKCRWDMWRSVIAGTAWLWTC